jgi:hypothetical protein
MACGLRTAGGFAAAEWVQHSHWPYGQPLEASAQGRGPLLQHAAHEVGNPHMLDGTPSLGICFQYLAQQLLANSAQIPIPALQLIGIKGPQVWFNLSRK